ncbi:MAG: hypothetical protein U1E73_07655 [Planctomycetota bacterium]
MPIPGSRLRRLAASLASTALFALVASAQRPAVIDLTQDPDQTIRAGEAFRAPLFGGVREQAVRDRRDVWAYDLGFANSPGLDAGDTLPLVSIYVWQHPDDDHLFRALLNGVANEVLYAQGLGDGGLEWVAALDTSNYPGESGEWIDGAIDDREKVVWGFARPGLGLGYRRRVGPQQDNMLAFDVLGEVGALWFGRGDSTSAAFAMPPSTLETRLHARLRCDLMLRNIVELPHAGWAAGSDAVLGRRARWRDWGDPAIATHDGGATRDYATLSAYAFGVAGVPGVAGGRHRLVGAVHAGLGDGVDRFSATRIGGGPDTRGGEFELTSRPVLPGAALGEYFPSDYALAYAGYRFEPAFFAFVDVGVTFGALDRDRDLAGGRVRSRDAMTALSARLSTGFFGSTRLQLLTAYDFDAVRHGDDGAWAVVLQVSGYF